MAILLLPRTYFSKSSNANRATILPTTRLHAVLLHGNSSNGLWSSRKASTMKADNPWYLRLEIDLLRQSGRNAEAIPVMQRLATLVPDEEKDNTLYELASAQGEAGQYAEGIKTLNQLEARNGPSPELADLKRQFWLKLGKPDKAIEEIRRLAEAQPLVIDYRLYLGQLYFEKAIIPP